MGKLVSVPDNLPWAVVVEPSRTRSATARLRNGQLVVQLPTHWPSNEQQRALDTLARRMARRHDRDQQLVSTRLANTQQVWVPFTSAAQVAAYVKQLNAETFQAPLQGVRLGAAKYTRIGQLNIRTGIMTLSRYCLAQMPMEAFRYLVLHELAHFRHPNHSSAFWQEVARFCPDYSMQREVLRVFHTRAVRLMDAMLEEDSP